jgi:hypothetical protein
VASFASLLCSLVYVPFTCSGNGFWKRHCKGEQTERREHEEYVFRVRAQEHIGLLASTCSEDGHFLDLVAMLEMNGK